MILSSCITHLTRFSKKSERVHLIWQTNVQQDQDSELICGAFSLSYFIMCFQALVTPQGKCSPSPVLLTTISKAICLSQHQSRLLGSRRGRPLQWLVGWERRRAPVRLIEVDVKRPCPVGEHPLLRDEAMVAAAPPALMWNVHGALIWSTWLIVVVGNGLVLRLPEVMEGDKDSWHLKAL